MDNLHFVKADSSIRVSVAQQYGDVAGRHLHFDDGFTLVAIDSGNIVGFASFVWRRLTSPLDHLMECFIDIIETRQDFRRKGIARRLVAMAEDIAKHEGAYQLRAWSSEDKTEALPMWAALQFGLAPAVVYPGGKEVHGFFVTKPICQERD